MTSILAIIGGISGNQFKCNYLRNQKVFVEFPLSFWNLHKILNIVKKNMSLIHYLSLSKIIDYGHLKGPASEHPSAVNVLKYYKHCLNVLSSVYILLLYYFKMNWVEKRLSLSDLKSYDCLLTHWMPMASILAM